MLWRRSGNLGKDLVLWPADEGAPLIHDENRVDTSKCARPVRYDNDDATALAHAEYGLRQRGLTIGIQIRVGLVEHHQEGIAVERTR